MFLERESGNLQGRIAYGRDQGSLSIRASGRGDGPLEFEVTDQDEGALLLRLTSSGLGLKGTIVGRSDLVLLSKYIVPVSYYRFGDGRSGPIPVFTTRPEYTPEARAAKLEGVVSLRVALAASGAVGADIRVVNGLGLGLDEKAMQCVKEWRFSPPSVDCSARPAVVLVDVQFVL